MADHSDRRNSNSQLLEEIEALSDSLFQSHNTRLIASESDNRSRSRRMSISSRLFRPRKQPDSGDDQNLYDPPEPTTSGEKKGIWSWKPMRALSHIRMRRLACLFSVEVIAVQRLPASMNGLRLSVAVRKAETKGGAVQTMPSRVLQGSADFDETLFVRCHLYYIGGGGTRKTLKFEPRMFLVSAVAVDAPELDFGKAAVDLSLLVQESIEKSLTWTRARQWDSKFDLSGKAKGGELVLKLGFQLMEDGRDGIKNQAESMRWSNKGKDSSFPSSRKQSRYSSNEFNLELNAEDLDLPEFEIIDKGIEIVKEVVHESTEHDSIAKQIKDLELMTIEDEFNLLDAEEETVKSPMKSEAENDTDDESTMVFLSDLAKGLGSVVQTRDGGYLVSMNPFDREVPRKETPKLAMQLSRPFVLRDQNLASGFEVFQRLAAMGSDELCSELLSLTAIDELTGKTAEQIDFEGVASAIISGRNKEGAIKTAKTMAAAMVEGRRERISTGIWSAGEDPVTAEEILATSLQRTEAMAVEALKIQAEMAEKEAPFDVSPLVGKEYPDHPLESAVSLEERGIKACSACSTITLLVIIQLRDPLRRLEAVGAPIIAVVRAASVDGGGDEEGRFKVTSLSMGGLKLRSGGKRVTWDGEEQRLTAMQWLVAHGLGKARKKNQPLQAKAGRDSLWSISSRVIADMFLNPVRKPDVKFP